MATVFANGRSIVHKGDGQVNTAAPPDVCKTPSPAGPVPIPYVNVAKTSDLAKGTKKIKIEGNPGGNEGSNLATSMGDEAGTAGGGLLSSKTKGKLTWATKSANVKLEGKGAVRFMDVAQHNGNSFNTVFTEMGGTGLAYGDDFQGKCPICRKGPNEHRIYETPDSVERCVKLIEALHKSYEDATSNNQKKKISNNNRGFMVGVMVCKHDPGQSFAARSGGSTPQFESVAARFVDTVIGGGTVEPAEFVGANTSGITPSRVQRHNQAALTRVNDAIVAGEAGFNPPGSCAASKLLARSGHAPVQMTEMFFKPVGDWSASYSVVSNETGGVAPAWLQAVLNNDLSQRQDRDYGLGASVASCHSCQEMLPLTLCPERVCS